MVRRQKVRARTKHDVFVYMKPGSPVTTSCMCVEVSLHSFLKMLSNTTYAVVLATHAVRGMRALCRYHERAKRGVSRCAIHLRSLDRGQRIISESLDLALNLRRSPKL